MVSLIVMTDGFHRKGKFNVGEKEGGAMRGGGGENVRGERDFRVSCLEKHLFPGTVIWLLMKYVSCSGRKNKEEHGGKRERYGS